MKSLMMLAVAISTILAGCGNKPAEQITAPVATPAATTDPAAPLAPAPTPAPAVATGPAAAPAPAPTAPAVADPTAPAAPANNVAVKAEPGRKFVITDLSVQPPRAVNVGDIKLKNAEAIRNFKPARGPEQAVKAYGDDPAMQTPSRSAVKAPPFQPKPAQGGN